MNLQDLLKECEARVSAGDVEGARRVLTQLKLAEIPSDGRFSVADLCRRTGLVSLGLEVLQVRPGEVAQPLPHENQMYMLRFFLEYGKVYPAAFIKRKLEMEGHAFGQFVNWAIKAGHIEREGRGMNSFYRLSAFAKKAA